MGITLGFTRLIFVSGLTSSLLQNTLLSISNKFQAHSLVLMRSIRNETCQEKSNYESVLFPSQHLQVFLLAFRVLFLDLISVSWYICYHCWAHKLNHDRKLQEGKKVTPFHFTTIRKSPTPSKNRMAWPRFFAGFEPSRLRLVAIALPLAPPQQPSHLGKIWCRDVQFL